MESFGVGRYALSGGVAAVLLAGCGGSQPPTGVPGAFLQSATVAPARVAAGRSQHASPYQVLYRFNLYHGLGSGQPFGRLTYGSGNALYGTTSLGGRLGRGGCCGTVYSITTTGTYNTVYKFRGHRKGDGEAPRAGLINVMGTLYGTTTSGGSANHGTVYSITPAGAEKVLHSFTGGSDGAYPASDLFYYDSTLFGTTVNGGGTGCGGSGCGTVYSITTSGEENVLYAFKGGTDGATPSSALIVYTDDAAPRRVRLKPMYGTTLAGGGTGCGGSGCGTVYTVTTTGQEEVLYSFAGGADGWEPQGLDDDRGELYGTTVAGGTGCSGSSGCGTVYHITTGGYKEVAYNFLGGSDGSCPSGPMIDLTGKLYGTTTCGGGCSSEPCGTVFTLTPPGTEHVLYRFTVSANGFSPNSPLLNTGNTLYGTTLEGGGSGKGYGRGVIYSLCRLGCH